jgi:hypothetical protein
MRRLFFLSALLILAMAAVISQPVGVVGDQPYRLFERYETSDSQQVAIQKLDALANQLILNPDYDAWLISYAGRTACRSEAKQRASAMRRYLLRKGVLGKQVRIIDGGFRDDWSVDMWLKNRLTKLNPTAEPTVKKQQVRFVRNSRCSRIGKELTVSENSLR